MRCEEARREIAAGCTGKGSEPPARDLANHLVSCESCREWLVKLETLRPSPAAPGGSRGPEDAYWISLLPRIRERIEHRVDPPERGIVRALLPISAALLLLFTFHFMSVMPPQAAGIDRAVTGLSGGELYEVAQSQNYSGLLSVYENGTSPVNGASSMSELLSELLAEEPLPAYFASLEPEEIVASMDDAGFSQFVEILQKQQ